MLIFVVTVAALATIAVRPLPSRDQHGCNTEQSQATEINRNADGATKPTKSACTRRVGDSGARLRKTRSAMRSLGCRFLHGVRSVDLRTFQLLTSRAVQFLDESQDVRAQYDAAFSPVGNTPTWQSDSPHASSTFSVANQVETPPPSIVSPTEGLTVLSLLNSESPSQPPHQSFSGFQGPFEPPQSDDTHMFVYQQPPGAPVLWPLEHEQEAMLLQHYLDHVALFVSTYYPMLATSLYVAV